MARLQRAFFTPGAAAANQGPGTRDQGPGTRRRPPVKSGLFWPYFLGFFGIFWDFLGFFLTFFGFFCFCPRVAGVGYLNFYIFMGTLFSIMFGDAIFD